jgi:uncharacterized membrane protein
MASIVITAVARLHEGVVRVDGSQRLDAHRRRSWQEGVDGMWHWGYDGWWMWLTMSLLWAVLIGLAIWWIRTMRVREPVEPHRRALEVLEERYARGEIDENEFRQRRSVLEARRE